MMLSRFVVTRALAATSVWGALCAGVSPAIGQTPGQVTLTPVSTALSDGSSYEFERGVLVVPQNREVAGGGVFELEFYRFPALPNADPNTPPIFHLNGGPGFTGLGQRPEQTAFIEQTVFSRVRYADWIVVGQRGIGTSTPNTTCRGATPPRRGKPYDAEAARDALVAA